MSPSPLYREGSQVREEGHSGRGWNLRRVSSPPDVAVAGKLLVVWVSFLDFDKPEGFYSTKFLWEFGPPTPTLSLVPHCVYPFFCEQTTLKRRKKKKRHKRFKCKKKSSKETTGKERKHAHTCMRESENEKTNTKSKKKTFLKPKRQPPVTDRDLRPGSAPSRSCSPSGCRRLS